MLLRLRKLREGRKRSQQDLASEVGCTRAAISHWECGRKLPPLQMISRLADALGVPEALLLHLDNLPRHPGSGSKVS